MTVRTSRNDVVHKERRVFQRVVTLLWLKGLGSTLVISLFFVAYFAVLNHPFREPYAMPLLLIDQWVPVLPGSAWIYFSLWVYICLPSSLMTRVKELGHYLMGAGLLSFVGLFIFYFLPTKVPSWGIEWAQYPMLMFLKESDASGNACPSLHVAFSLYSGLWLDRVLNTIQLHSIWRHLNAFWCLLIILSTMTTKQHVLLDVISGVFLAALCFGLNERLIQKVNLVSPRN